MLEPVITKNIQQWERQRSTELATKKRQASAQLNQASRKMKQARSVAVAMGALATSSVAMTGLLNFTDVQPALMAKAAAQKACDTSLTKNQVDSFCLKALPEATKKVTDIQQGNALLNTLSIGGLMGTFAGLTVNKKQKKRVATLNKQCKDLLGKQNNLRHDWMQGYAAFTPEERQFSKARLSEHEYLEGLRQVGEDIGKEDIKQLFSETFYVYDDEKPLLTPTKKWRNSFHA